MTPTRVQLARARQVATRYGHSLTRWQRPYISSHGVVRFIRCRHCQGTLYVGAPRGAFPYETAPLYCGN